MLPAGSVTQGFESDERVIVHDKIGVIWKTMRRNKITFQVLTFWYLLGGITNILLLEALGTTE